MYVIKEMEQIDLQRISVDFNINKLIQDKRAVYYGAYFDSLLVGFILALDTIDFLLITYIYVEENYRKQGIGHNLLLKLKNKGEFIKKRLCLKIYDIPNKSSIISFFMSEGFSIPQIVRRNGIIHMKSANELFSEKRKFNATRWLSMVNGSVKVINLRTKSNEEKQILENIKQIYDYTYLKNDNLLDIVVIIFINNDIASWIICHEISSKILNIEYFYTDPPYRKHSIGFISFTFLGLELFKNYSFEYLSFTTVKDDDKLLSYYKYLFKESLIKIVDTEISIYPKDEET